MTARAVTTVLLASVEPPVPPTSGARLRNLHAGRVLARTLGVEVVAVGHGTAPADTDFSVTTVSPRHGKLGAFARSVVDPYQAVVLRAPGLAAAARSGPWASIQSHLFLAPSFDGAAVPVVIDAYDVESATARLLAERDPRRVHRLRWRWEAAKTGRFERRVLDAAAGVCAASDGDAEQLEQLGARDVVVAPNGVAVTEITHRAPDAGTGVVFVGSFGYRPNQLAAEELVREILPRLRSSSAGAGATLDLVGRQSGSIAGLAGGAVTISADVPDPVSHLHRARVTVMPLRAGSGTRLKVLEAFAAGTPVVATPLAVAGLGLVDGQHVLLGSTAADLAAQAGRVIADDALAGRLSSEGRRLVEEKYDWSQTLAPLVDLHRRVAAR